MKKTFLNANELLEASFALATRIFDSGFRPTFIAGIWRGGASVAVAVQEYLRYKNIKTDHIAIRAESYTGIGEQAETVRVHGLRYLVENLRAEDRLLLVDDIFDSGKSMAAVIEALRREAGANMPEELKIACPWYKPGSNRSGIAPDFYLHETDAWVVFPHELLGLEAQEILRGKPELARVLQSIL